MRSLNLVYLSLMLSSSAALAQSEGNTTSGSLAYPKPKKVDQTDTYHGTTVADPYRWLEDDRSAETAEWVKAENKVTFDYLGQIPYRQQLQNRLEQIYNYPKYSAPSRKGEWFYFSKNDGLQNQSVLYRQKGLDGKPELVIDPNKLSADGTTRLGAFSLSKDGKYAVVGLSKGGSDWQEYQVMDLATKQYLSDKIEWVKVSGAAWQGDGFYYSRYPKPEGSALAAKNENHQVYYHKLNTPQSADRLVYEDPQHPQRFHIASTTEDERFLLLSISDRGKGKDGNALLFVDSKSGQKTFTPVVEEITDFSYGVIDNDGDRLLILTNEKAPNSKVVAFSTKTKAFSPLIPEKPEPIAEGSVSAAGGKLFVEYSKDVTSKIEVFDYAGKRESDIQLPAIGSAGGFGGEKDDKFVFYTFTSFTFPPTIYRYDIATRKSTVFRAPEVDFKPTDYETKQVFYTSKDGTKVPMFLTYRKGIKLDGTNPTLLYGYGGFNISLPPAFSPLRIPFLEQGGVYAQANLRGGSEYGEKWHEQGMKLKKQNVFDDFIAAAEYLIAQKYTSPAKLAVQGGSNGGLLVGAVINQRPDLFRVAIPQVGVMDMLRFHKFTIGWNWIADYGSSDNADEFKALYAYSPIHNLKAGVNYPATLITTADHDDRVVPAHSFKYAATLQEVYKGQNPVLIRIDTNSGHGASNTKKNIETTADIYSFILWNMGVRNLKEIASK
ncbi:prolyl oligopeptidase family serine peptidase [Spirosoma sp. RP8]|uniref:prolyl oligopeptidase n=2 Tax=Spirosoma liriopis TaxID=2937440 RepID=A0ABT0HUR4_9BACT|nr:prolyl oligopeptidase family serine peptidase [Spirosoma liriopis]MCK8495685.1 prolyl oligopeptidase family serine peptidase [Spirosoma liriopis]